ncbi:MAG: PAS domain-containing protein [Deltaproteobacteria bacterium]|nr:PAS domain-containing protein [Deltaproteobacteria bacterium]
MMENNNDKSLASMTGEARLAAMVRLVKLIGPNQAPDVVARAVTRVICSLDPDAWTQVVLVDFEAESLLAAAEMQGAEEVAEDVDRRLSLTAHEVEAFGVGTAVAGGVVEVCSDEEASDPGLVRVVLRRPGLLCGSIQVRSSMQDWRERAGREFLDGLGEVVCAWAQYRGEIVAARKRLERVWSLLDSTDALIFAVARNGKVLLVNRAMARVTGTDAKRVVGKPMEDWIPRRWQAFHQSLERLLSGLPIRSFEAELPSLGVESLSALFVANVMMDQSGRGEAVVAVGYPYEMLDAMGGMAMRGARLATMAELAQGVLAELDDPMMSIKVHAEALKGHLGRRSSEAGRLVDDVLAGVARLSNLAEDLVAYSRASSDEPVSVSLNELVEDALSLCHAMIVDRSAVVRTVLAGDLPAVVGLQDRLRQVLVNLLLNALHALDEAGGRVVVRTWDNRDGTVGLSVSDDGVGIAEEDLDKVFDPFYSTDRSTGLGLTLVRDVVLMHGGRVEMDSELGEGTVVTVTLSVGETDRVRHEREEPVEQDEAEGDGLEGSARALIEQMPRRGT